MTLVFLSTTILPFASGQTSIRVCGTDLKPGITKDAALQAVSIDCEIKRLALPPNVTEEMWCLKHSDKSIPRPISDDNCPDVAEFDGGRLIAVTKLLARAENDGAGEIANLIYQFAKMATEDGVSVTVRPAGDFDSDGWRIRIVQIYAGESKLTLTTSQPIGRSTSSSSIKLEETVALPK